MNRKQGSEEVPFLSFGVLRLFFGFTQLTQLLLNGKVSFTSATSAEARHVQFPLHVTGVIPGQLSASLHNTVAEK